MVIRDDVLGRFGYEIAVQQSYYDICCPLWEGRGLTCIGGVLDLLTSLLDNA